MKYYSKLNPYQINLDNLSKRILDLKIYLKYFTYFPSKNNIELKNIILSHYKVIVIEQNSCELYISNDRYIVDKGDLIIIPPFTLHSAKIGTAYIKSYEIFFNLNNSILDESLKKELNISKVLHCKNIINSELFKRISLIYDNFKNKEQGMIFFIDSLLKELLILAIKSENIEFNSASACQSDKKEIESIIYYLKDNINTKVKVKDICDYLNISQSRLYSLVNNALQMSPQQLIIRYKMIEAEKLLHDDNLSINEISFKLGFDNPFYFTTIFKKEFSVSPSTYRRTLRVM